MSDEADDLARDMATPDTLARRMALDSATAEEARAYLRKQNRLTDLQIENLQKIDCYETSHLRWRRFNDQMKGALQILVVTLGAMIVMSIVVAMWNASQADGIVVKAFSVPPSFEANGVGGDVVADDLTDKIAAIRDIANGNSFSQSKDVRSDRAEDIKVEIPQTGVSFAQAWHYLKAWLGHERPLRGNVRTIGNGKIVLTVVLAGDAAEEYSGSVSDFESLEQQAAEHVFASVDPNNFVLYLDAEKRSSEALAAVGQFAESAEDPKERSGLTSLWSVFTREVAGDVPLSIARARYALSVYPGTTVAHREIMVGEHLLGHDEAALKETAPLLSMQERDLPVSMQGRGYQEVIGEASVERDIDLGDFNHAQSDLCFYCSNADALLQRAEYLARSHDLAGSRALSAQAAVAGDVPPPTSARTRIFVDMAAEDGSAAAEDAKTYGDIIASEEEADPRYSALRLHTIIAPLHGEALARSGQFEEAEATMAPTPRDCYHCVRIRGVVEALRRNWTAASVWFAEAVGQGPSLPFACTDWGEMLLHKGDYEGAIAKFHEANLKGPHFADPLEMWGEALMQENRSDLALAKFEEANKYAPNWGRLHLEWGKALLWSGDNASARKQFSIASGLGLAPAEMSELARLREVKHG
ncbi:MAG TPA: hypothetical protein VGK90_03765 [Rhizomicrobium sp.]|jgi:tetratricopeptide (TPR) repeat protein